MQKLDLELGLENLARIAAQYDDEEADARAARFVAIVRALFRLRDRAGRRRRNQLQMSTPEQ